MVKISRSQKLKNIFDNQQTFLIFESRFSRLFSQTSRNMYQQVVLWCKTGTFFIFCFAEILLIVKVLTVVMHCKIVHKTFII